MNDVELSPPHAPSSRRLRLRLVGLLLCSALFLMPAAIASAASIAPPADSIDTLADALFATRTFSQVALRPL